MTKTKQHFDIRPLSDALGAEIQGVDLSQPLDADTVAAITDAWHEHIVLLFRDQDIDTDRQIVFAEHLGMSASGRGPPNDGRKARITVHRSCWCRT